MRLYLDEHVPVALSSALAAHGVDCLTTQEAGNLGRSDEDQLAAIYDALSYYYDNREEIDAEIAANQAVEPLEPAATKGPHKPE